MSMRRALSVASLGLFARVGLQACTLLILTRLFTAADYGAISALVALTSILMPVVGLGLDALLVRETARDAAAFPLRWGQSLLMVLLSGTTLSLLLALAGSWLLPGRLQGTDILLIAFSDLVLVRLLENFGRVYQVMQRSELAPWLPTFTAAVRLAATTLLLVALDAVSLTAWALAYALSALVPVVVVLPRLIRRYGRPAWDSRGLLAATRQGSPFFLNAAVDRTNSDIDKVLLARMGPLEVAGLYALAYRCFSMATVPIHALLGTTYARFFVHGQSGIAAAWRYARRLLAWALPGALLISLGIVLASALVAPVFGAAYAGSADILIWLAPVAPLVLLRYTASHVLGSSHRETPRLMATSVATGLNILLNLLLIPTLGWQGAIVATLASETVLCALLLGIILWHCRRPEDGTHA